MSKSISNVLLSYLAATIIAGCASTSPLTHVRYPDKVRSGGGTSSIAFVSDTQSPLWFEKFALHSDNNKHATKLILEQISRDSTCVALFHLGDITGAASDDGQWKKFDTKAGVIRQANIPIYPALGNHEYLFSADEGKYNAMVRFPSLRRQWYVKRAGSVAVILLNSNFSHLLQEETRRQQTWYEQALDSLDRDTAIAVVLVGCHHSPYTNSMVVNPSENVQRRFVVPFMKSKKAKLFLSGHSHAFEHFQIDGKSFLVLGGGGGLLHPLLQGSEERWHDEFRHRDRRSFFHYLRILPRSDTMSVEVQALTSQHDSFKNVYKLEIPYAQK
jgi:predicted phosphodiesterase